MSTNKVKKERNRRLIFGAMFASALILIMISVSFSWFYNGKIAKVSGVTVDVSEANNLLVKAEGDGDWQKVVQMPFEDGFLVKPVTGDGISFYHAQLGLSESVGDFVAESYVPIPREDFERWGIYEFSFSFKVEGSLPLYLTKDSTVTPLDPEAYDGIYGDYSAGHIGAALRVAILEKIEGEYVPKLIWIPNATTRLITEGQTRVIENGSAEDVEATYLFVGATALGEASYVQVHTDSAVNGIYEEGGVTYAWGVLAENLVFSELSGNEEKDFRVVIWLDGNDRECHNALMGGKVSVHLNFAVDDGEKESES